MPALDDRAGDPGDLVGCLPLTKHHFRKPLAGLPAVVHPRECEILDGVTGKDGTTLVRRLVRIELAGPHRVEQCVQGVSGGRRAMFLIRHGFRLTPSRADL